jgi:hypothetical protein
MLAQHVNQRTISNLTTLLVVQLAQQPTGPILTTTCVNHVMNTAKKVVVRQYINALLVKQHIIFNLITLVVFVLARYPTTLKIAVTHVSHVI